MDEPHEISQLTIADSRRSNSDIILLGILAMIMGALFAMTEPEGQREQPLAQPAKASDDHATIERKPSGVHKPRI